MKNIVEKIFHKYSSRL